MYMEGKEVGLHKIVSIKEQVCLKNCIRMSLKSCYIIIQKLYYSQDGSEPTSFRYQRLDEHGMPYIAQTHLRLGTNYHLELLINWFDRETDEVEQPVAARQTHRLLVFRDLDDILAV